MWFDPEPLSSTDIAYTAVAFSPLGKCWNGMRGGAVYKKRDSKLGGQYSKFPWIERFSPYSSFYKHAK